MKAIPFATLAIAVGCSAAQALDVPTSRPISAQFAAVSITASQGVRAIISNTLLTNDADLSACPVVVTFFGADGSLIGAATTVQLKPGESTSVPASAPTKLVR